MIGNGIMTIKLFRNITVFLSIICTFSACVAQQNNPIKVVITGHTCAGKTSLINELKKRNYFIVPEVATAILFNEYTRLDREYPELAPHNDPNQIEDLQLKIFTSQLKSYQDALEWAKLNPPKDNLIIFDRSEIDTYVYSQIFYPPGTFKSEELSLFDQFATQASSFNYYFHEVIFCEIVPREYYDGKISNVARHETYDQALYIGDMISDTYQKLGFTLRKIGFQDTISKKADLVAELLSTFKNNP